MKLSVRKNWIHYLQEGLGLAIFMISACFFSAMLYSQKSPWFSVLPGELSRNLVMGVMMGSTALFIFYSPLTSASGSHINPAVTLTFLRLGKMCRFDALFYVVVQLMGGITAVYTMQQILGDILTNPPVSTAVTVPGKPGMLLALITELCISFLTMSMVLYTSHHHELKKYTRLFSGCLVCAWVIIAGPISGFGMNPARSLASALPANIWTAFWIYLVIPFAGMLLAAEGFLYGQRRKKRSANTLPVRENATSNKLLEPLEFLL
jgi:aquaporin Z